MTFYNMIFTALPLAAKAIFDQDVYYVQLVKSGSGALVVKQVDQIRNMIPYVYKVGQTDAIFNNQNFLFWVSKGIIHGFLIWLLCIYGCQDGAIINDGGHNIDFWFTSVIMFTSIYVVATLQKIYMIRYWTIFNVVSLTLLSLACYIGWMFLADLYDTFDISRTQDRVWRSSLFYLLILLNAGWFTVYYYTERFLIEMFGFDLNTRARVLVKTNQILTMSHEEVVQAFDPTRDNFNKVHQKDLTTRIN